MPQMTCRAGMRVLYALSGMTWAELACDLNMPESAVKRVSARNDNWPQGFGAVDYHDALLRFAATERSTTYGALLTVRQTLEENDALTGQARHLLDDADRADDERAGDLLDRVADLIYATAHPASRAASHDGADACDGRDGRGEIPFCSGGVGSSGDAGGRTRMPAVVSPNVRSDVKRPGALAGDNARVEKRVGAGEANDGARMGLRAGVPTSAISPNGGKATDSVERAVPAETFTFSDLRVLLCGGQAPVAPCAPDSDGALMRALLPASVTRELEEAGAAAATSFGACPVPLRRRLTARMCSDEGLCCRETLARCEALLAGVDEAAFAARVERLRAAMRRGDAVAAPGPASPALTRDPLGYYAAFVSGDDAPAGRLFVLVLFALLGPDAVRVLEQLRRDPALCRGRL